MAWTRAPKCDPDGRLRRGGPVCSRSRAMTGSRSARMRAAFAKVTFWPGRTSGAMVMQLSLAFRRVARYQGGELGQGFDAELGEGVLEVRLHRVAGQEQPGRDLRIGQALARQAHDRELRIGQ